MSSDTVRSYRCPEQGNSEFEQQEQALPTDREAGHARRMGEKAKKVLGAVAGGVGAVVTLASQTSADDVTSNLGSYAKLLGFERLPPTVLGLPIDAVGFAAGMAALAGALWLFWPEGDPSRRRKPMADPRVWLTVLLVVIALGRLGTARVKPPATAPAPVVAHPTPPPASVAVTTHFHLSCTENASLPMKEPITLVPALPGKENPAIYLDRPKSPAPKEMAGARVLACTLKSVTDQNWVQLHLGADALDAATGYDAPRRENPIRIRAERYAGGQSDTFYVVSAFQKPMIIKWGTRAEQGKAPVPGAVAISQPEGFRLEPRTSRPAAKR